MNAIIIEDEKNVKEGFIKLLNMFCPQVKILATAENITDGFKLIEENDFDVLFLDINLPDGSGFDLIHQVSHRDFALIFVTAYNQYAIDAFRISAIDYLLKPVSPDLLKQAIKRVENGVSSPQFSKQVEVLDSLRNKQKTQDQKILLRDFETVELIKLSEIIFCKANGSYTEFCLENDKTFTVSLNLKEYESLLEEYKFIRVHHSYLVNAFHIKNVNKSEGGSLLLSKGYMVPMSNRKRVKVIEKLNKLFIG